MQDCSLIGASVMTHHYGTAQAVTERLKMDRLFLNIQILLMRVLFSLHITDSELS